MKNENNIPEIKVEAIPEYNEKDFWNETEIDEMNDILSDLGLENFEI